MPERPSHYVHGTTPEEQRRLSKLNDLLNRTSLAELHLSGGERILDVGSGLGQMARGMARAAGPQGSVLGIERSPEQIEEATRQAAEDASAGRVEFRAGDALDPPLSTDEWGRFDLAHARFILEHVPDPLRVVRAMVRAVRPGGRIVLEDDDHEVFRQWPEIPGFAAVWSAYMRTYEKNGNDPIVGRRLVQLLHQAGAKPRRNKWISFGACSGDPEFPDYVENVAVILEVARDAIVDVATVSRNQVDDVIAIVRSWKVREDAALWFARSWAEGIKPD
jgi:SAM-dependent methyltransferase